MANANFGGLLRDIPKDDSTTIDRFMDSPLEEYPVSWTLIANAAENATYNQQNITLPIFQSRSSSVHSGADSGTSGSSCASVASFSSRTSRKGRRAFAVPVVRSAKPAQNVVKPRRQNIQRFFCTFCPKGFVGRYEWVRHEESVHMPRKMWVCNLQPIISSTPDHPSCQYCAQAEPSDAHMSRHKHEECLQRSREERTFHRYDHLKQHLRLFHGATNITGTTELWSLPGEPLPLMDLALICGFCGFRAGSWEDRCVHLTNHFLEGVDMSRWWLHRRYNEPPSRVVLLVSPFEPSLRSGIC